MPRIAIIGATAAGLYASDLLMRCVSASTSPMSGALHIDLFDPAPAPISVSTSAHVRAHATAPATAPRTTLRLLGNITVGSTPAADLSLAEVTQLYDAVLIATDTLSVAAESHPTAVRIRNLHSELAVQFAVGEIRHNLLLAQRAPEIEVTQLLAQRQIAHTIWDNPLQLPTDWTLEHWQRAISTAHGAPVCF